MRERGERWSIALNPGTSDTAGSRVYYQKRQCSEQFFSLELSVIFCAQPLPADLLRPDSV